MGSLDLTHAEPLEVSQASGFSPVWIRHPRRCAAVLVAVSAVVVLAGRAVSFRAGEWVALELEMLAILVGLEYYLRSALRVSATHPIVSQLRRGRRKGWTMIGFLTAVLVALLALS